MAPQSDKGFPDEGLIIDSSIEIIRKAAAKVIYEFDESVEGTDGKVVASKETLNAGDQVVFRENIST